jgi:signal transduction histidine kinase
MRSRGAQQRLVSLSLRLGILARAADPVTATAVEACVQELRAALEELRELARGIHPVVLTERGLEPALQALAERSPVPVEVDVDDAARDAACRRRTRRPCTSWPPRR